MNPNKELIIHLPDSEYSSFKEAYAFLKSHGIDNGYGFHVQLSRPHGSNVKTYVNYRCDKSRSYKSQATIRDTKSRSNACPFSVVITQDSNSGQWRLQVKNSVHNHLPLLNPMAHNVYRRRTPAQKESIQSMSKAGAVPRQILTAIRQDDPSTFVDARDVRNDRVASRANYLAGRSLVKALLDELSTEEWVYEVKRDN
jgi:hypothetical protein